MSVLHSMSTRFQTHTNISRRPRISHTTNGGGRRRPRHTNTHKRTFALTRSHESSYSYTHSQSSDGLDMCVCAWMPVSVRTGVARWWENACERGKIGTFSREHGQTHSLTLSLLGSLSSRWDGHSHRRDERWDMA